jgi:hypothetical protein
MGESAAARVAVLVLTAVPTMAAANTIATPNVMANAVNRLRKGCAERFRQTSARIECMVPS